MGPDPRVAAVKALQEAREAAQDDAVRHPDAQRAGHGAGRQSSAGGQGLRLRQELPRLLQALASVARQLDAPAEAIEQRAPELVLERSHLTRQRRLRTEHRRRRAAESAGLRNRDKCLQLSEFHLCGY